MTDKRPSATTRALLYGMLGNLSGINRRLAKAISAHTGGDWIGAIRNAKSDIEARTLYENAINEAMSQIAAETE